MTDRGRFMPGQSGNPGGRPKDVNGVSELARGYGVEAVERLAYWMRSEDPKTSIAAAVALLSRGFGKPTEYVELAQDSAKVTVSTVREAVLEMAKDPEQVAALRAFARRGYNGANPT